MMRVHAMMKPTKGCTNRVCQTNAAPEDGTADPRKAYTTANSVIGTAASTSEISIAGPASSTAGEKIENIATPIAAPAPSVTTSISRMSRFSAPSLGIRDSCVTARGDWRALSDDSAP